MTPIAQKIQKTDFQDSLTENKKLRVAIIGCISVENTHGPAIIDNPKSELIAVCDINEKRAIETANKYNTKYYFDYKKMITKEQPDVVHICTPHFLHIPMTLYATKHNCHVFCEKPIGVNINQVNASIEEIKATNKKVGVCFQNRFLPSTIKLKSLIESGKYGKVLGVRGLVTWNRNKDYYNSAKWRGKFKTEGAGVLINQSIHTLDILQYLVNSDIVSIGGNVSTRVLYDTIEVEDTADATINFKNGVRGIFYATNCYTEDSPVSLDFHMEKGNLYWEAENLFIKDSNGFSSIILGNKDKNYIRTSHGTNHAAMIDRFYTAIIYDDDSYLVSMEEACVTLKIIDAIYKSSATGRNIDFK